MCWLRGHRDSYFKEEWLLVRKGELDSLKKTNFDGYKASFDNQKIAYKRYYFGTLLAMGKGSQLTCWTLRSISFKSLGERIQNEITDVVPAYVQFSQNGIDI